MRDRLIELLRDTFNYTKGVCIEFDEAVEINADYLLANGVVVIDTDVVSPENRPLISQYMGRPIDEVINLIRRSEWISVEERLPEDTQMCLAYATVYFVPDHVGDCDHFEQIIVTKYYKEFGFMDWDVHYWMPLPEAPKMKGGAE